MRDMNSDRIRLFNENIVETVCLLGRRKPDAKAKISIGMDDYYSIREAAEKKESLKNTK